MKTTYIYDARDVRVVSAPDSEPGPGQVLLDVAAVGICGSDLHTYTLGNVGGIVAAGPLTLGHEASGRIIALGPGVEGLTVGQRVAIDPAIPCQVCERCWQGDPHLCTNLRFLGLADCHGAMRERMVHPARACVPVPESVSDIGAAMLEPLGVALHASRLAHIQIGEDVAVLGCGAIGLLLVRLARLAGARRIFAVDRFEWRLNMAANFGADAVFNADRVQVVEEILRATSMRGVDVALEAAWVAGTLDQCAEVARFGGRVIIVGIPAEDEMKLRASVARRKELLLQPSRRMKHTYPAAIALAADRRIDVDALASHRFTLDQAPIAFETAANYQDGVVRAMVLPGAR